MRPDERRPNRTQKRLEGWSLELTFELVDDLAFAADRQLSVDGHLSNAEALHLGPCLEYMWLRRRRGLPSLRLAPRTPVLDCLREFVDAGAPVSSDLSVNIGRPIEVSRVPSDPESPYWMAFLRRVQVAAHQSGYPTVLAAGLAGAVGEMASNAVEHSGRPETAVMAYHRSGAGFEFAIGDAGVGVRTSLSQCPDFQGMSDSAEALAACIQEGISRHGIGIGRGLGFTELFRSLANLDALVRFRSDDQALTMEGRGLGPLAGTPAERPRLQGFIVSVRASPLQIG